MIRVNEIDVIGETSFSEPPTYELGGKERPVEAMVKAGNAMIPLVGLKMMTDLKLHKICLESRLENPQPYSNMGEDVEAVIEKLRRTIAEMEAADIEWNTEESPKIKSAVPA